MGVVNLISSEKQRRIDEIEGNLEKLNIPEELRKKIMDEIDDFFKIQSISWFDMPQEMRELVIEEMEIETKSRFAQCSRKCAEEIKNSKHFLTGILTERCGSPEIWIELGRNSDYYYYLKFIEVHDSCGPKTKVVYYIELLVDYRYEQIEKWTKMEDGNVEEVHIKYFNEYIQKYSRTIQKIKIMDSDFLNSNFDMKQFPCLNYFKCCFHDVRKKGLMEWTQIKKLNECFLPETVFTFQEVLRFEGQFYEIKSNDFDEEHFEKYLKMLKNGETHKNLKRLKVEFEGSSFAEQRKTIAKSVDSFDYYEEWEHHVGEESLLVEFGFRFLQNYRNESKYYCQVDHTRCYFYVTIISDDYDKVMENRQPLAF